MSAKKRYKTIVADPPSGKTLGSRDETVLQQLFPSSPLSAKNPATINVEKYADQLNLTEQGLGEWFVGNIVNGTVPESNTYYGFSQKFSLDFAGAPGDETTGTPPDYKEVKWGGGAGNPATPWTPNPASPGEGNGASADKIPDSPAFSHVYWNKTPTNPGSGDSANEDSRNPKTSSSNMKTTTLSATLGKSSATLAKKAGA
jgi:hypothetical protein